MINQQLLVELKTIIKEEHNLDLSDQEIQAVGDQLIKGHETLIRLQVEEDDQSC